MEADTASRKDLFRRKDLHFLEGAATAEHLASQQVDTVGRNRKELSSDRQFHLADTVASNPKEQFRDQHHQLVVAITAAHRKYPAKDHRLHPEAVTLSRHQEQQLQGLLLLPAATVAPVNKAADTPLWRNDPFNDLQFRREEITAVEAVSKEADTVVKFKDRRPQDHQRHQAVVMAAVANKEVDTAVLRPKFSDLLPDLVMAAVAVEEQQLHVLLHVLPLDTEEDLQQTSSPSHQLLPVEAVTAVDHSLVHQLLVDTVTEHHLTSQFK